MKDIPGYEAFTKIEPVTKGWSSDRKYTIETAEGRWLLLRVASIEEYNKKKTEFEMMGKVAALGIPMSQPVDFGVCDGGSSVYQLLSWCDGEDAETAVPRLAEAEQYALGIRAGQILKNMQALSSSSPSSAWAAACGEKHRRYLRNYRSCGMTVEGDTLLIRYVEEHQHLLENRPMCFSHDDYHLGNLILSPGNALYVIDFQKFRNVDPYHAMCGLIFTAQISPHFAAGQVRGYFGGEAPADFWESLALHMAAIALNFLPYKLSAGQGQEIGFAYRLINDVLLWFDNMRNPVPTWYNSAL